jgi:hypothetical protein
MPRTHARKEYNMSKIGDFQKSVKGILGNDFNFQIDSAHGEKPDHVDLTVKILGIGADKVEVDLNGNVIGGLTQIGPKKLKW